MLCHTQTRFSGLQGLVVGQCVRNSLIEGGRFEHLPPIGLQRCTDDKVLAKPLRAARIGLQRRECKSRCFRRCRRLEIRADGAATEDERTDGQETSARQE